MKTRKCALFLFDGYADWEPSLVTTGLNNYSDFSIQSFSIEGKPVTSMGGLIVSPTTSLEGIGQDFDLLLLPGGNAWETGENQKMLPLIQEAIRGGKTVAAICAATIALADAGILNTIPHTSNEKGYLERHSKHYSGQQYYVETPCVASDNIITANGAGMIEFAHEIYKAVEAFDTPTIESITALYKSGGMINHFS